MSTRRLRGGLVLALAAGTLFPAAGASARAISPPTPAAQRFGVRLAGVPVAEEHNPRAYRYIIDYLPAAAVIHRRIMVLNEESRPAHFTVYPDAAQISHGSFVGDDGATRSELTTWISVQHPELTLGPHTSAMDMITIRVSREPTRGEHYGVIWVQQETRGRAANGVALNEVARVGVRIYLAVGPGGVPPTNFTISAITGHHTRQGALVITAQLRNTGGRAVDLDGTARLTRGPGGTSAGPYPVHQVVTIAPGQSYPVTFIPGRRLPSGPWHASISLVSGFTKRTASATILFSPATATAGRWGGWTVLAWIAGLLATTLAAASFLARRTRRSRAVVRTPSA